MRSARAGVRGSVSAGSSRAALVRVSEPLQRPLPLPLPVASCRCRSRYCRCRCRCSRRFPPLPPLPPPDHCPPAGTCPAPRSRLRSRCPFPSRSRCRCLSRSPVRAASGPAVHRSWPRRRRYPRPSRCRHVPLAAAYPRRRPCRRCLDVTTPMEPPSEDNRRADRRRTAAASEARTRSRILAGRLSSATKAAGRWFS